MAFLRVACVVLDDDDCCVVYFLPPPFYAFYSFGVFVSLFPVYYRTAAEHFARSRYHLLTRILKRLCALAAAHAPGSLPVTLPYHISMAFPTAAIIYALNSANFAAPFAFSCRRWLVPSTLRRSRAFCARQRLYLHAPDLCASTSLTTTGSPTTDIVRFSCLYHYAVGLFYHRVNTVLRARLFHRFFPASVILYYYCYPTRLDSSDSGSLSSRATLKKKKRRAVRCAHALPVIFTHMPSALLH